MTGLIDWVMTWLEGGTARIVGLTLVHFLWEGLALALLLFAAVAFCRRTQTRYLLAVCTLAAMLIVPILTFAILRAPNSGASNPQIAPGIQAAEDPASSANGLQTSNRLEPFYSATWPGWCAGFWLGGVLLFSLRAMGGWVLLARLRREHVEPLSAELIQKCRILEQRLRLNRRIRYLQSKAMDTPSVLGWFRPVVLMPVCAISGLSVGQLEAVIVHELAHIKRLDCFVNLFQVAAETLLFYHPAVWWVNRVIRNERENCCDDISVEVCGNATEYARALTLLESARATPEWALAATGGVLRARIVRLLRPQSTAGAISTAGFAVLGILCATGVLVAAAVVTRTDWQSVSNDFPPHRVEAPLSAAAATAATIASEESEVKALPSPTPAPVALPRPKAEPVLRTEELAQTEPAPNAASASSSSSESYIDGLKAAGLKDLTIDEIISLKIQGVTPDYISAMRATGFDPSVHDVIAMKVQGITPDYVKQMRATGLNPTLHELIGMKVQGITPAYVREMQSAGLGEIRVHELIGMKVQNVDPAYIRGIRATGLNPSVHELISMKVQDVTPDYIRALKSAGLGDLKVRDYIGAKVQDVTPEFIEKVRSHGFKNLTLRQLIALKNADVF